MRIRDLINFSADYIAPGATIVPSTRNKAVDTKARIQADASPSDLASHHTWQEPSASDLTIKNWRSKRQLEKQKRRNMDPFEPGARLEAGREVTGPCGCTLKIGERVLVEEMGKGNLVSRKGRILTVNLDGHHAIVDQKFVHRLHAYGTSEGAVAGWETRGHGRKDVHENLLSQGFKHIKDGDYQNKNGRVYSLGKPDKSGDPFSGPLKVKDAPGENFFGEKGGEGRWAIARGKVQFGIR